jgi:hypothetical protein
VRALKKRQNAYFSSQDWDVLKVLNVPRVAQIWKPEASVDGDPLKAYLEAPLVETANNLNHDPQRTFISVCSSHNFCLINH